MSSFDLTAPAPVTNAAFSEFLNSLGTHSATDERLFDADDPDARIRLTGAEWRADDSALDLAEGTPSGSPRLEGLLGSDEVPRCGAFEISGLDLADPDVAVTREPPLHVQFADQVSLHAWTLPPWCTHCLAHSSG